MKTFYYVPMLVELQLFAEVQVTTQPSLSAEMKTYYDMTLIDEATANLVHDQFAQKRPIPKNGGKTIEFRKFAPLAKATTPLTEGVTPAGKSLSVSTIHATVNQYGDFVTQSDVLELTSLDNTILEATKLLGQQAGVTLDTVVRDIINSGTNVTYCPKVSGNTETEVTSRTELDTTAQLTVKVVQRVVTKLKAQNAPKINGDYVAIIHPYVAYDLMRDPEWIDAHKYATPENIYEGEIGKIAGVRFVETTEAKIFRAPDLSESSRNLRVDAAASGDRTITFGGGGYIPDNSLKGRCLLINGKKYYVGENTSMFIVLCEDSDLNTPAYLTCDEGTVIYPGEAAQEGVSVFSTLFIGAGAYGTTEIEGGGLQTIVKQKGSAGTSDPLDQRSSVGWKGMKTAEILIGNYLVRVESCSGTYSAAAAAN